MSNPEVISHVNRLITSHEITPSKVGSLKQPMYKEQVEVGGRTHQVRVIVREYGRVGGMGNLIITDVNITTYPTDNKVLTTTFTVQEDKVKEVYANQHGWDLVLDILKQAA